MGELVIQFHAFENAKEELKKFSEKATTDLDLKRVDNSKSLVEFLRDWAMGRGIGLNHTVTGEELNELTTQIQTHLHSINNIQIELIREFGQVYSALEALDKDYIQAILVSIKETEETSQSIQATQEQIKKIVENQIKTLEELNKFQQKLDGYAHLGDIDEMWESLSSVHTSIQKMVSNNQENINSLLAFMERLSALDHLMEVDDVWKQTEEYELRIKDLELAYKIHADKLAELAKEDSSILQRINSNEGHQ